jgi:NlpC/P60 family putative phage cell wall peptidase
MSAGSAGDVVSMARGWVGTPYCHRASRRGAGCDCLGFVRGIRRELGGADAQIVPWYAPGWAEIDGKERLWDALRQHLRELPRDAEWVAGQVLLFRMRDGAAALHLGILSEVGEGGLGRFVHAYERHGVTESPLSAPWKRRVVARFELV